MSLPSETCAYNHLVEDKWPLGVLRLNVSTRKIAYQHGRVDITASAG